MPLLKYYCKRFGVNLEIEETIIEEMILESRRHYPKEFGGILLGRYSDNLNTAIITDIMMPIEYDNSRNHFRRGNAGVKERLRLEFNKKPSIIYLGEWHTHPDSTPDPSQIDINTLRTLSQANTVMIENPIMLIIGLKMKQYNHIFYTIKNKNILSYE
ncbi:Mov34/MPN/PAD-1 family protein [Imperialibacter roseus]|uniref:Mov34/MPN/PAD-1 family protein n=1 Tax=Imperialibacter roseus TaxID=1324217 RepID=A0ABZ0IXP8_9BACT|nr:Mov34/MPN/PAD-1 family protein [Imperialibacter roseus]WOK09140.1 Mov34/MPN/PAD-1 family protein [Imperialibacter roseus]